MVECIEYRFGKIKKLVKPIQWLSDNGPCYVSKETVTFARSLGFDVCTLRHLIALKAMAW